MRLVNFVPATALILVFVSLSQTQAPDESAKAKLELARSVLQETVARIGELRLPENRAYADAMAGKILWEDDKSRAEALFTAAGDEISNLIEAVNAKPSDRNFDNQATSYRQQVLNLIAEKDAALALDILERTRPPSVIEALATRNARDNKVRDASGNGQYIAENERNLESNLARAAATQAPEKAVAILKASIAKPLSGSTWSQLWMLADRDHAAGTEAASSVIARIEHAPLMRGNQRDNVILSLATQILDNAFNNDEPGQALKIDQSDLHGLAQKLLDAYLSDVNFRNNMNGDQVVRYAEKFAPASIPQIRRLVPKPAAQTQDMSNKAYNDLTQATPEQMVAGATKYDGWQRQNLYSTAAGKYSQQGNVAAARAIYEENYDGDARRQALEEFDQNYFNQLVGERKFAEAEAMIPSMPEKNRIGLLAQLATSLISADGKNNRDHALSLLTAARGLAPERPETQADLGKTMQVVNAYAQNDPAAALDMIERLIPRLNEVMEASAVVLAFQGNSGARDGEFVIANGSLPHGGIDGYALMNSARADLDRTLAVANSFSRPEVRILLRLQMLQNSLDHPENNRVDGKNRIERHRSSGSIFNDR